MLGAGRLQGFRALFIKQQAMGTSSRHPAGVSQGLYQTMTYNVKGFLIRHMRRSRLQGNIPRLPSREATIPYAAFFLDFLALAPLLMSDLWMCGITPPGQTSGRKRHEAIHAYEAFNDTRRAPCARRAPWRPACVVAWSAVGGA